MSVCTYVCVFVRLHACIAGNVELDKVKAEEARTQVSHPTALSERLACLIVQLSNAFCFHNDVISEHVHTHTLTHTHTDPGARTHKHTQSRARGAKQEMPRAWPGDLYSLGSVAGRSLAPS